MNFSYLNFSGCFFVLFRRGHFHNVVSTFINIVKLDVENNNVFSTLLDVVHVNVEIHNVVSMLIWRCPTSRRHANQKTTLKQRWNVCWVVFYSELFFLLVKTIFYNLYYYCSLIFWIFLSMEVVFRSKKKLILKRILHSC